jgi:MFS family permease
MTGRPDADAQPPAARLGSIVDRRRWRLAMLLGGVGDTVGSLLPLFALGVVGTDVGEAAGTAAAYTFGSLAGNVLIWGRLADRVRSPRALIVGGTAVQGASLVWLAAFPTAVPLLGAAAGLGLFAVSMDAPLVRLVAGDLPPRERLRAAVRFASFVERGILVGLMFSALALPLLGRVTDEVAALRIAMAVIGGGVLLESALALSTITRERAAPRLADAISDLSLSGAVVVWAGATTPIQRVLRVAPFPTGPFPTRRQSDAASDPLPESLTLMLVSLAVLHAGFAMQGNLMGLYLREEANLEDGAIVAIFLLGSALTNVAVDRVGVWLDRIPAVQVQVTTGAVRTVVFAIYAGLAVVADANWSLIALVFLFCISQLSWGAIVSANSRRFADLSPPSRRGEVAALQSGFVGSGIVAGAALGGAIAGAIGFPAMFATSALLALAGTVLLLRW